MARNIYLSYKSFQVKVQSFIVTFIKIHVCNMYTIYSLHVYLTYLFDCNVVCRICQKICASQNWTRCCKSPAGISNIILFQNPMCLSVSVILDVYKFTFMALKLQICSCKCEVFNCIRTEFMLSTAI